MKYTLKEAEKLEGVPSERTLKRHLKNGTISGEKNTGGQWLVLAAELHRAYGLKIAPQGQGDTHGMSTKQDMAGHDIGHGMTENPQKIKHLEDALKAEKELSASYKSQVDDLKGERDEWREIAKRKDEQLQLFLPAPDRKPARSFPWGWATATAAVLVLLGVGGLGIYGFGKMPILPQNLEPAAGPVTEYTPVAPQTATESVSPTEPQTLPSQE